MSRDEEIVLDRALGLIFGLAAQAENPDGSRRGRSGGSGIFVAPYLAVTARHVVRDFWRINELRPRDRPGYFETPHGAFGFQVNPKTRDHGLWVVDRGWEPTWTDISMLQLSPELNGFPTGRPPTNSGHFPWSLLPPPIGAQVTMVGYPKSQVEFIGASVSVDFTCVVQRGRVTANYPRQREQGMLNFPCFEIDAPVDGGFSGGPVFYDGQLCGLVSASMDTTYAAALWPLCLLDYEYTGIGGSTTVGALLDDGVIQASDWSKVKPCISKQVDDCGKSLAFLEGSL